MNNHTLDSFAKEFVCNSCEEILSKVNELNTSTLSAVINLLNEQMVQNWKEKLNAIILGLHNKELLEVVGQKIALEHILYFFENSQPKEDTYNKILALLVGMNPEKFTDLIKILSEKNFGNLLQTTPSEPLQHQLTIFAKDTNTQYIKLAEEAEQLFKDIENLQLSNIEKDLLINLKNNINDLSLKFHEVLDKINRALRLAWNTDRIDLIETLSHIKERYLHTLHGFIGHMETAAGATGLYEFLRSKTDRVYGESSNFEELELLNKEPSIEALINFSIWYLPDYWELGLLPEIKTIEELEPSFDNYNDEERNRYREELFNQVKHNLEKLHLKDLSDLKKAQIFSKESLKEYISKNFDLIKK